MRTRGSRCCVHCVPCGFIIISMHHGSTHIHTPCCACAASSFRYHQPVEGGKVEIDFVPEASDPWFAIRRAFESARKSLTTAGIPPPPPPPLQSNLALLPPPTVKL